MRYVAGIALCFALLSGSSVASAQDCQVPQAPTVTGESISCATPRPGTAVWRIDQPNVKQKETSYCSGMSVR